MPAKLDLGTREEVRQIYTRVFGAQGTPDDRVPVSALRGSILTAISPLRLDFEVHRLRGKAIEGEKR